MPLGIICFVAKWALGVYLKVRAKEKEMNKARIAWWRPREWGLTLLDRLGLATCKSIDELVAETAAVEVEIKRLEGLRQQKRQNYQPDSLQRRVLQVQWQVAQASRRAETARQERQRCLTVLQEQEDELRENLRVTRAWVEMFNERKAL